VIVMQRDDVIAIFDRQAEGYDKQWEAMAPIRGGLYLLVEALCGALPDDARVLCVGVGTGAELASLARRFPGWRFTAVEPSGSMLEVCRSRAAREGIASRCTFHEAFLDAVPIGEPHDAATCFLVSQFILDPEARSRFFRDIAVRLRPGGLLVSSDLASGANSDDFEPLLRAWLTVMAGPGISPDRVNQARAAYARDVAVLPPTTVASIIEAGGFDPPVQFFQAGLLHAWLSTRVAGSLPGPEAPAPQYV
jgi:tRNA (cmo5U34)-methyltransferase